MEDDAQRVYIVNAVAVLIHTVLAIVVAVLVYATDSANDIVYELVQTVVQWIPPEEQASVVASGVPLVRFRHMVLQPTVTSAGVYISTTVVVVAFFGLSAVFQSIFMFGREYYTDTLTNRGVNFWRYIEYSFSASIMLVLLTLQVGIWEWGTIVCVFTCCWSCMMFGLFAELWLHMNPRESPNAKKSDDSQAPYADGVLSSITNHPLGIPIAAHLCGWVALAGPFAVIWGTLASYEDAPREAVILICIESFCFLFFGFTQVVQFMVYPAHNMAIELAYIVQSIISKTALAFGLYSLVLVNA